MENRNGISKIIIIVVAIFAILIVACIVKALSGNNSKKVKDIDKDYTSENYIDESDEYQENSYSTKEAEKVDPIIAYKGVNYDLTKTPRESGIEISMITDADEQKVQNYDRISDLGDFIRDKEAIKDVVLQPNAIIMCKLEKPYANNVNIKNTSNTAKNIYDCDIVYLWTSSKEVSFKNMEIGKTTEEEIKKAYNESTTLKCKNGGKIQLGMDANKKLYSITYQITDELISNID